MPERRHLMEVLEPSVYLPDFMTRARRELMLSRPPFFCAAPCTTRRQKFCPFQSAPCNSGGGTAAARKANVCGRARTPFLTIVARLVVVRARKWASFVALRKESESVAGILPEPHTGTHCTCSFASVLALGSRGKVDGG